MWPQAGEPGATGRCRRQGGLLPQPLGEGAAGTPFQAGLCPQSSCVCGALAWGLLNPEEGKPLVPGVVRFLPHAQSLSLPTGGLRVGGRVQLCSALGLLRGSASLSWSRGLLVSLVPLVPCNASAPSGTHVPVQHGEAWFSVRQQGTIHSGQHPGTVCFSPDLPGGPTGSWQGPLA